LFSEHIGDIGAALCKDVFFDSGLALLSHTVICEHEDNRRLSLLA
jgi:hypothetical protein